MAALGTAEALKRSLRAEGSRVPLLTPSRGRHFDRQAEACIATPLTSAAGSFSHVVTGERAKALAFRSR